MTTHDERVRAAFRVAIQAMSQVPICDRPDAMKGPPFSVCKGCGARDQEKCAHGCWVWDLNKAICLLESEAGQREGVCDE